MKHILFFITHKTLTLEHAELTFQSLASQECDDMFDEMIIYNTHPDDISNSTLLFLCNKYNLDRFFKKISLFSEQYPEQKSLGADVHALARYSYKNFEPTDRILLLKSDSLLSKNYFDEVFKLPEGPVYFVAPFICAKKRVANEEILDYIKRDTFIRSDDITFFVEDQTGSPNNDFNNRPGINVTDEQIKFTSCYVITDFSCHLISVELLHQLTLHHQSWGGAKFYNLVPYFRGTDRCFVVHKYHGIISENRDTDREGPVKDWLNS